LRILAGVPSGPHDGELLRERGRAHQRLGGFHTGAMDQDLPRALRHHDAALQALEARVRLDPGDAVARRNWADQFVMKATAHNMMRDGAGALDATRRGLDVLAEIATADPRNVEAQHDLAFAYSEQARALAHLERYDEAERSFDRAASIHARLIADDPSNAEDRRDLARLESMRKAMRKQRTAAPARD
jgi:tetratricopeptide (TPR) repeat protein